MVRELLVSRIGGRYWAVGRETGLAVELRSENVEVGAVVGRICNARVSQVVPSLQSAFLDVGGERSAFIHNPDLLLPGDPPRPRRASSANAAGGSLPPIEHRLKAGREIVVQISREAQGSKGDRATSLISIAGRFLVLGTGTLEPGVSRRIRETPERERLLGFLNEFLPQTFVARTAARGASRDQLVAEAERLAASRQSVRRLAAESGTPCVLSDEPSLPLRLLRDAPAGGYDRVVLDQEDDRLAVENYLEQHDPGCRTRVEIAPAGRSLLEAEGLRREFERALQPRIWLPSGGCLVIEETEALVSIDVNTAKSVRGNNQARTIVETNVEAAHEIARQLRIRNLGGIVVIDFIDMIESDDRDQVVAALERALYDDPSRTKIGGLGDLGLLQLTRKRTHATLAATLTVSCSGCSGRGRIPEPAAQRYIYEGENTAEPRQPG